jgi:hypothetical protein
MSLQHWESVAMEWTQLLVLGFSTPDMSNIKKRNYTLAKLETKWQIKN